MAKGCNSSEHHAEQAVLCKALRRYGRVPRGSVLTIRHRIAGHCSMPCSACARVLMLHPHLIVNYIDQYANEVTRTPAHIYAIAMPSHGARHSLIKARNK
jgi:cytidine deaminase